MSVMHEGQVSVAPGALASAVADQFPHLAGIAVRAVSSAGTEIAPFRVGPSLVARLPLVPADDAAERFGTRRRHAEVLGAVLPVAVPRLVGVGAPFDGYPGAWSLWEWLPGDSLDHLLEHGSPALDLDVLAVDLATLLHAHRSVPTEGSGWSGTGRGGTPLADSEWVRTSIERSRHLVDPVAATRVWETALAAPPHHGAPVAINGDPMPGNLLVVDGRLTGLVDIGAPVVGDPAADLQPAWEIFDPSSRATFRDAMAPDDAAWERGRGWAFEMAIGGLHYYEHSNPVFFRLARRTLDRLLDG